MLHDIPCGAVSRGPGAVAAIKDGMVQIVHAFLEKLAAFKFLPRTERKLKEFVDFN